MKPATRFVVWDVERARPVSEPILLGLAERCADALELEHGTPFVLCPAPCCTRATPSFHARRDMRA